MRFACSSLVICFIFFCGCILESVLADYGTKRWKRIPLSDVVLVVPTVSTFMGSVSQCAATCFRSTPICETFAFNRITKACLLFTKRVFAMGRILSRDTGLQYYWIYEDNCPSSYNYDVIARTCIKVIYYDSLYSTKPWTHNQGICEQDGGYLYIMDTVLKQSYIKSVIQAKGGKLGEYGAGGGDSLVEGKHLWFHGGPVDNLMWAPLQPDDYGGEDCLLIAYNSNIFKVNDINCRNWMSYICEVLVL